MEIPVLFHVRSVLLLFSPCANTTMVLLMEARARGLGEAPPLSEVNQHTHG